MTKHAKDIQNWIQELITRSAAEQMRSMQRLGELLQRTARGELDQEQLREEYQQFSRDETTRYIEEITRLGVGFYNALLDLNRQHSDRFFDRILGVGSEDRSTSSVRAVPSHRVEVDLHAPLGEVATRSFVVENKHAETMEVSFLISEFASEAGAAFRPPLQLQPPRFTLRPGEERVVTLRIPLLPEMFVPGQRYEATVIVRGHDDLVLVLNTWADSPPAPDDLMRLRGIGPGYARRLREADISTFAELAALEEHRLFELVGPQGLQRARRDEWLAQARLAAMGDEAELKLLQEKLSQRPAPKGETDGR